MREIFYLAVMVAAFGYFAWRYVTWRQRWELLRQTIREEGNHIPDHLFGKPEDDPARQEWLRYRRNWSESLLGHMEAIEEGRVRLTR